MLQKEEEEGEGGWRKKQQHGRQGGQLHDQEAAELGTGEATFPPVTWWGCMLGWKAT